MTVLSQTEAVNNGVGLPDVKAAFILEMFDNQLDTIYFFVN